ncbi:FRG domain-containing protein [Hymenobacter sp. M29]|uniref:FRG domain-containing protein n=1 Tax=Hymenobacter mellowenesis TaxID=3063995 RepID=A0ABT9A8N6_9BACT|nr:FRG domain-containing protein [Hymenobacter sp. M29]MDO7846207.1 FRG domain-containing protein [Hymenobacter sp. M29]
MQLLTHPKWIEFLSNVHSATEQLGNPDIIWFRGQGNAKYTLLPSLLRFDNGLSKEEEMFHTFRRFSEKIFHANPSEWETLFNMQHYHIPTRLLDWSETFGVALYFAVNSNNGVDDSAIYLLDPLQLNKECGREKIYRLPYDEDSFKYSDIYWHKKPFKATSPIAVEPVFQNDRIIAQRGTFTVHHNNTQPIETQFPKVVKKITISEEAIPSAKEFLKLANINEFTVYPDVAGIAEFIKKSIGLQ